LIPASAAATISMGRPRQPPLGSTHGGAMPEPGVRRERPPLLVVEGNPARIGIEAGRLRAAGFDVIAGFRGRGASARAVVRTGVVADAAVAADALLAALDGAGLLVDAVADRGTIDRLVDDLRHIGPVEHVVAEGDGTPAEPDVPPESRAILGLLAEGHSLGEAAAILGLSRRTADRRLGDARRALGVTRTTEAIASAGRLGWLRAGR
jgi:DNA-binding CsgD family transcriptional regulator